jgi:Tol biopolymer transport system component
VTDLTNGVQPAWSPDGERLAFVRCPRGQCGIFLIDIESRAVTQLDLGGVSDALHPSWSPDGTTITFSGHPSGSNIYTVPAAGGPVSVFLGSAESLAWRP